MANLPCLRCFRSVSNEHSDMTHVLTCRRPQVFSDTCQRCKAQHKSFADCVAIPDVYRDRVTTFITAVRTAVQRDETELSEELTRLAHILTMEIQAVVRHTPGVERLTAQVLGVMNSSNAMLEMVMNQGRRISDLEDANLGRSAANPAVTQTSQGFTAPSRRGPSSSGFDPIQDFQQDLGGSSSGLFFPQQGANRSSVSASYHRSQRQSPPHSDETARLDLTHPSGRAPRQTSIVSAGSRVQTLRSDYHSSAEPSDRGAPSRLLLGGPSPAEASAPGGNAPAGSAQFRTPHQSPTRPPSSAISPITPPAHTSRRSSPREAGYAHSIDEVMADYGDLGMEDSPVAAGRRRRPSPESSLSSLPASIPHSIFRAGDPIHAPPQSTTQGTVVESADKDEPARRPAGSVTDWERPNVKSPYGKKGWKGPYGAR